MSESQLTISSELNQPADGYIVIAPLSEHAKKQIATLQDEYVQAFGRENVWVPSGDQLHITFCHLVSPDASYKEERATIFSRLRPLAVAALEETIPQNFGTSCTFDRIEAYPAAVIVRAMDDGTFHNLRSSFVNTVTLPSATRKPPEIIHTTLVRFLSPIDFGEVQNVTEHVLAKFVPFSETVSRLQLIHEKKIFVQEQEVLTEFPGSLRHDR